MPGRTGAEFLTTTGGALFSCATRRHTRCLAATRPDGDRIVVGGVRDRPHRTFLSTRGRSSRPKAMANLGASSMAHRQRRWTAGFPRWTAWASTVHVISVHQPVSLLPPARTTRASSRCSEKIGCRGFRDRFVGHGNIRCSGRISPSNSAPSGSSTCAAIVGATSPASCRVSGSCLEERSRFADRRRDPQQVYVDAREALIRQGARQQHRIPLGDDRAGAPDFRRRARRVPPA